MAGRFDLERAVRRRQGSYTLGQMMIPLPEVGRPEMTAHEADRLLEAYYLACLPVVRNGHPVGYVTRADLIPLLMRRSPRMPHVKPVRQSGRSPRTPGG
jgi:CBS domain-containing protein